MNLKLLNKYLVQHKSLSIPGLGALVVEDVPAVSDFTNRQIHPMQQKIRFDKYFDSPDRDFFTYIGQQQQVPDFEAIRWYNEFAYQLRLQIRVDGKAEWKGLGIFVRQKGGDIQFEAEQSSYALFEPVTAERVIRQTMNHAIRVGDQEKTTGQMVALLSEETQPVGARKIKWWKWALGVAILGVIILLIHFFINGFHWGGR